MGFGVHLSSCNAVCGVNYYLIISRTIYLGVYSRNLEIDHGINV